MLNMNINWLLMITLTIGAWVLSFLWFTVIFRKPYAEAHGRTKAQLDAGPPVAVASAYQLIGNFIMIVILAWLVDLTGVKTVLDGLLLGAGVWLGFVAGFTGPMYAFQAYSLKFFFLTTGYALVVLTTAGALLA